MFSNLSFVWQEKCSAKVAKLGAMSPCLFFSINASFLNCAGGKASKTFLAWTGVLPNKQHQHVVHNAFTPVRFLKSKSPIRCLALPIKKRNR